MRARLAARRGADAEAIAAADEAASELKLAIQELRELARGIHPAILTEAGLGAAITALADRSAVPATVRSMPDRRLPPAVEATAYFIVSEALANVAKHASATSISIAATSTSTHAARRGRPTTASAARTPTDGTGIRGLQDRVAAIGGRLPCQPGRPGHAGHRRDPDRLATAPLAGGPVDPGYWTVEFVNVIESPRKKIPG